MANISDIIADALIGHTVDLMRFEARVRREALYFLKQLEQELVAVLENVDPTGPVRTIYQEMRLTALLEQVREIINTAYRGVRTTLNNEMRELTALEIAWLNLNFDALFVTGAFSVTIAPETIRALVREQYIDGELMGGWLSKQRRSLVEAFTREIRNGMLLGEPNSTLIRRIRGEPTGKRTVYYAPDGGKRTFREYTNSIVSAPLRQLKALVRTATLSVANDARRLFFEDNLEFYKGWQALTTLDFRTSDICIARTGAVWHLDGRPWKNTHERFPGYPPWHWNCRSLIMPVLKTWEEMGLPAGMINEIPETTRASMNGQVAKDTTYDQWLSNQPLGMQKDKLGPTKFRLWKEGKLKFTDLIDQFGRPLTVAQLKEKYGL